MAGHSRSDQCDQGRPYHGQHFVQDSSENSGGFFFPIAVALLWLWRRWVQRPFNPGQTSEGLLFSGGNQSGGGREARNCRGTHRHPWKFPRPYHRINAFPKLRLCLPPRFGQGQSSAGSLLGEVFFLSELIRGRARRRRRPGRLARTAHAAGVVDLHTFAPSYCGTNGAGPSSQSCLQSPGPPGKSRR